MPQGEYCIHSQSHLAITLFPTDPRKCRPIHIYRKSRTSLHVNLLTYVLQLADTDMILKKRAEVAARLAEFKKKALGAASVAAPPVPAQSSNANAVTAASGAAGAPSASVKADLLRRVAEATRRAAETSSRAAIKDNPYMVRQCRPFSPFSRSQSVYIWPHT